MKFDASGLAIDKIAFWAAIQYLQIYSNSVSPLDFVLLCAILMQSSLAIQGRRMQNNINNSTVGTQIQNDLLVIMFL